MRKALLSLVLVPFLLFGLIRAPSAHAESDFKVTLLGTASPQPFPDRFGPSTLVEAGDQRLLFDAGRGVPIRLGQINVPLAKMVVRASDTISRYWSRWGKDPDDQSGKRLCTRY